MKGYLEVSCDLCYREIKEQFMTIKFPVTLDPDQCEFAICLPCWWSIDFPNIGVLFDKINKPEVCTCCHGRKRWKGR
jgi:hypothetical protein